MSDEEEFGDNGEHEEASTSTNTKAKSKSNVGSSKENALTREEVKSWVDRGFLKPGNPPSDRKTSAPYWKEGAMRYLFWQDSSPLLHWYYCEKCGWTIYMNKLGGTGAIKNHWDKHLKEEKYELSKEDISALLAKASTIGNSIGSVTEKDFRQIMFTLKDWNNRDLTQFWKNAENRARKHEVKTESIEKDDGLRRSGRALAKLKSSEKANTKKNKSRNANKKRLLQLTAHMPLPLKKKKLDEEIRDLPVNQRTHLYKEILGLSEIDDTEENENKEHEMSPSSSILSNASNSSEQLSLTESSSLDLVESHSKRANTDEISGKPVKNPKIDEKNETKTEEKNTEPGQSKLTEWAQKMVQNIAAEMMQKVSNEISQHFEQTQPSAHTDDKPAKNEDNKDEPEAGEPKTDNPGIDEPKVADPKETFV